MLAKFSAFNVLPANGIVAADGHRREGEPVVGQQEGDVRDGRPRQVQLDQLDDLVDEEQEAEEDGNL